MHDGSAFRWPSIRPRRAALLLALLFVYSMLQGSAHWLSSPAPYLWALFASGAVGAWVTLPLLQLAVLHAPSPRSAPLRFLAVHSVAYASAAVISKLVHRVLSAWIARVSEVELPAQPFVADLLFDVQTSLPVYAGFATLLSAHQSARDALERRAMAARLRRELDEAKLAGLSAQLDGAELLRELAAVRVALHRDVASAESMLDALGSKLRAALASEARPRDTPLPTAQPSARAVRLRLDARHAWWALLVSTGAALLSAFTLSVARPEQAQLFLGLSFARCLALWLALPISYLAVRTQPDPRTSWLRWAVLHSFALPLFMVVLVAAEYGMALLAQAPAPSFARSLLAELQYASNAYLASAGVWTALFFWHARDLQRQHEAELAQLLSATRLASLTAQLEPHFLFNALNTIGALSYAALERSQALLADLEALLGSTLGDPRATWSLREERTHLTRYLAFVDARFGDRVAVAVALGPELDGVELPRFALQGLVENAVKHNQADTADLRITVQGAREAGQARFEVADDGQGFSATSRAGGLARLDQVLRLLYGAGLERGSGRGARIRFSVPHPTFRQG
ncbi:MAG: histidine kinase [Polyangiales bacterium]